MTNTTASERNVLAALRTADCPLTVVEIADVARCSLVTVRRRLYELVPQGRVVTTGSRPRLGLDGSTRRPGRGPKEYTAR